MNSALNPPSVLQSDALTISRSRLIEITYTIRVTANTGSLTADVSVELPITVINFISLYPPPRTVLAMKKSSSSKAMVENPNVSGPEMNAGVPDQHKLYARATRRKRAASLSERAFMGDDGKAGRYPREADPSLPRHPGAGPSRPPIQQHRYSLPAPHSLPRNSVSANVSRAFPPDSHQSQNPTYPRARPTHDDGESDADVDVVIRSARLHYDEDTHGLHHPSTALPHPTRTAKVELDRSRTVRGDAPRLSGPRSQSRHKIPSAFLHHEEQNSIDTESEYIGRGSSHTAFPEEEALHESVTATFAMQPSTLDRTYDAHPSHSSSASDSEEMMSPIAKLAIGDTSREQNLPLLRNDHCSLVLEDTPDTSRFASTPITTHASIKKALPASTSIKARIAELQRAGLGEKS